MKEPLKRALFCYCRRADVSLLIDAFVCQNYCFEVGGCAISRRDILGPCVYGSPTCYGVLILVEEFDCDIPALDIGVYGFVVPLGYGLNIVRAAPFQVDVALSA